MIPRNLYWFLSSKKLFYIYIELREWKSTSDNRPKLGILWGFTNILMKKRVGDHIYGWTRSGYNFLQDKKNNYDICNMCVSLHQ